jgi:hypothetical protein
VTRWLAGLCLGLVGLLIAVGCSTRDWIAQTKVEAYSRGYAQGLAEGMATPSSVPADPDVLCHIRLDQLEDELDAAATCEARLLDHQRTAAAGRESARLLGWDDGYRTCRSDWRPDWPEAAW